jgi:isopentenyl phosphate kinase
MPEAVLLKLGGSVLTRKGGHNDIMVEQLERIGETIGSRRSIPLAIVHGAGSCGHPEARRYGLDGGLSRKNLEGVAVTHQAVSRLNTELVAALKRHGSMAIGIHPLHAGYAENGRLVSMECRQIQEMIACSMVPVLHGDVVMDGVKGASIISGDQLVVYLARALRFGRIGLATDVPGVLDGDRVIPEVTPASAGTFPIMASGHTDVTGGMAGKVRELLDLARDGTRSAIFHVDRLGDFLDGKPHGGTVVRGG